MMRDVPAMDSAVTMPRRPFGMTAAGMVCSALLHAAVLAIAVVSAHRAILERQEEARRRTEMQPPPPPPFSFIPARLL
jgi:hypothetical protein